MNNAEIRARYRTEDVKALRAQLQVGDVVTAYVSLNKIGERLIAPVRVEHRITAKYPHMVELDTGGAKRRTATYVDILLGQVEGGGCDV